MKHKNILLVLIMLIGAVSAFYAVPNSVKFNGITGAPNEDHIAIGDLTAGVSTTYTAEAWFNATQLTGGNTDQQTYGYTIMASSTVVGGYPLWITAKGTELNIWSYTSTAAVAHTTVGAGLTTNAWYHVAVTAVKGGATRVYVNGILKLTYTNENQLTWNNVFTIGALRSSRPISLIPFHGLIDEVRIWNVVRTQADIQAEMYRELATVPASIKGYWQLNQTAGTAPDLATPAHIGTLLNGASWNVPTGGAPFSEVTLASTNPAVAPASVNQGDLKVPAYRFTLATTGLNATLNEVIVSTTGTYGAADLVNLKLWYNTLDDISTAITLGTLTTGLGVGTHTFTGLTQSLATGATRYLWVTADLANPIVAPKTFTVSALAIGSLKYPTSAKTGAAFIGGEQTVDAPLPVELTSFTALLTAENYVTVKWITQSETSVGGYYVYRAMDGDFASAIKICDMIEASNSPLQQVYQYNDNELDSEGTYYYWLQVQELNGTTINHGPTTVNFSTTGGEPVVPGLTTVAGINSIYPNPITPYSVIGYTLTKAADVKFKVYNSRGQLVNSFSDGFKTIGNWNSGWNGKDFSGNNCPTGIYYIKMQAGTDSAVRKAVIVK